MENVKRKLGFLNCLVVSLVGRKGVAALLWNNDEEVKIMNYSNYHIHACLYLAEKNLYWSHIGFLSKLETNKRGYSWNLLSSVCSNHGQPWCIMGDFNENIAQDEKRGGRPRLEKQMEEFRQALESNGLYDYRKGQKYTWINRHEDDSFTKERLDRVVANQEWLDIFRLIDVEVLTS